MVIVVENDLGRTTRTGSGSSPRVLCLLQMLPVSSFIYLFGVSSEQGRAIPAGSHEIVLFLSINRGARSLTVAHHHIDKEIASVRGQKWILGMYAAQTN